MNNDSNRRIVHVGLPKAASTLLQNRILSSLDGYLWLGSVPTGNIGRSNYKGDKNAIYLREKDLRRFYDILLKTTTDEFRQKLDMAVELQESLIQKHSIETTSKGVVFSSEFLTSTFFSHGNVLEKAERVQAIWPKAEIIILIREQYSMLVSQYADQPFDPRNMTESRAVSMQEWLEFDRQRGAVSLQNSLDYAKLYRKYCQLFGRENVHVLLFEDIVNDKLKIAKQLSRIFGADLDRGQIMDNLARIENTKPGVAYQGLRKLKRVLLPKLRLGDRSGIKGFLSFLSGIGPAVDIPDHREIRDSVRDFYNRSNQELDEVANLGLKRYGYIQ